MHLLSQDSNLDKNDDGKIKGMNRNKNMGPGRSSDHDRNDNNRGMERNNNRGGMNLL